MAMPNRAHQTQEQNINQDKARKQMLKRAHKPKNNQQKNTLERRVVKPTGGD